MVPGLQYETLSGLGELWHHQLGCLNCRLAAGHPSAGDLAPAPEKTQNLNFPVANNAENGSQHALENAAPA